MSKNYQFSLRFGENNWGHRWESLEDVNGNQVFQAHDMSECPEDAILGRDLFTALDFVEAVKLGMKLAKEGYENTDIVYKEIQGDEDEE